MRYLSRWLRSPPILRTLWLSTVPTGPPDRCRRKAADPFPDTAWLLPSPLPVSVQLPRVEKGQNSLDCVLTNESANRVKAVGFLKLQTGGRCLEVAVSDLVPRERPGHLMRLTAALFQQGRSQNIEALAASASSYLQAPSQPDFRFGRWRWDAAAAHAALLAED